jgi:nucleoside-diphosphate-sugar epimerase
MAITSPKGSGDIIVVTGARSPLGRRVVKLLAADPTIVEVRTIDDAPTDDDAAMEACFVGATLLIHLIFVADTEWRPRGSERDNVGGARRLLTLADSVTHIVGLSSALVYGAWPNNPVPLTEDAPLRPNPEFAYATQRAQIEQLFADWVADRPGRTATVLRPCLTLSRDNDGGWIARSLAAAAGARLGEEDPAAQFLHTDDLATAVDLARRVRLDGPYNVAPDGWVRGETVRALAGARPRLRLPEALASRLAKWRWTFQQGPVPPGLLPYAASSWVIANDRLKAAGWKPRKSSEQAYVAGTEARWWTLLTPKRKQELALGGMAGFGTIAVAATSLLVRRVFRRRGGPAG